MCYTLRMCPILCHVMFTHATSCHTCHFMFMYHTHCHACHICMSCHVSASHICYVTHACHIISVTHVMSCDTCHVMLYVTMSCHVTHTLNTIMYFEMASGWFWYHYDDDWLKQDYLGRKLLSLKSFVLSISFHTQYLFLETQHLSCTVLLIICF